MEKWHLSLLLLAVNLLSPGWAAAPVANIQVHGNITPPTCALNGQAEDTYTYTFDISPGLFPAIGNLGLSPQSQNIEVVCDAATYLTFIATDERAGTELLTGINLYGLGTYNTNTKIGHFAVRMANATVKTSANASATKVGLLSGAAYVDSTLVLKNQVTGWAISLSQLAAGQIFAADFTVIPTINGAMKNSAGDAELDGSVLLTFAFGL